VGGLHHAPERAAVLPTCTWTRVTARSFSPLPLGCGSSRRTSRRIPPTPSSPPSRHPVSAGAHAPCGSRSRSTTTSRSELRLVFADAVQRPTVPSWNPCRATLASALHHWSGPLLEWLEAAIARFSTRWARSSPAGRWSFSPVLLRAHPRVIPPWDQQGQLERNGRVSQIALRRDSAGRLVSRSGSGSPELPDASSARHRVHAGGRSPFLLAGPSRGGSGSLPRRITMGHVGVFPIERELATASRSSRCRSSWNSSRRVRDRPACACSATTERIRRMAAHLRVGDGTRWPRLAHALKSAAGSRPRDGRSVGFRAAPRDHRASCRELPRDDALGASSRDEARIEGEQRWLETQGKQDLARRIATGSGGNSCPLPESRRLHRRVSELSARIDTRGTSARSGPYGGRRKEVHDHQLLLTGTESSGLYLPTFGGPARPTCCRADALADGLLGGTAGGPWSRTRRRCGSSPSRVSVGVSRRSGAIVEMADGDARSTSRA